MAKFKGNYEFSNMTSIDDVVRFLSMFSSEVVANINGKIDFTNNIQCRIIRGITFPTANAEVPINHTLGFVPNGYAKISANVACNIYNGTSTNTSSVLYLKCDQVANVSLLVF